MFARVGQPMLLHCGAVCGGRLQEGTCCLLRSQWAFSHFLCYPQANWALPVLIPGWLGSVYILGPVGVSKELSYETGSFSHHHNPHNCIQSEVLRLYFPTLELWLHSLSHLQLFTNVGSPALPAATIPSPPATVLPTPVLQLWPCCESSPLWLPVSAPPTCLDKCFFFNYLVVGLPYSSIFWQFWLYFVFKFVVVLLLVA